MDVAYQHNALSAKPAWWGVDVLLPSIGMTAVILWAYPRQWRWQVLLSAVFALITTSLFPVYWAISGLAQTPQGSIPAFLLYYYSQNLLIIFLTSYFAGRGLQETRDENNRS